MRDYSQEKKVTSWRKEMREIFQEDCGAPLDYLSV
jgi:hypothetical protein